MRKTPKETMVLVNHARPKDYEPMMEKEKYD